MYPFGNDQRWSGHAGRAIWDVLIEVKGGEWRSKVDMMETKSFWLVQSVLVLNKLRKTRVVGLNAGRPRSWGEQSGHGCEGLVVGRLN